MRPRDTLGWSAILLLAFGLVFHACPADAALTVRYADFDLATGLNNGETEDDAWQSWAQMETDLAAGMCVNIQQTASRDNPGADIDITVNGTNTAPILLVGYKTTAGDCGATGWGDGGDSGISNYFQSGAGNRRVKFSGNNYWVMFWDWEASVSFGDAMVQIAGDQVRLFKVRAKNTNTGGVAPALNIAGTGNLAINSRFASSQSSGTGFAVSVGQSSILFGSRIDLTASTSTGAVSAVDMTCGTSTKSSVMYSMLRGPDAAGAEVGIDAAATATSDDTCLILGNSFRDFAKAITVEGIQGNQLGNTVVAYNVAYNVGTFFENEDSAAYNLGLLALSNAMQSNTADWTNVSPKPLLHDVDLTADPFTDTAWDMRLNATAGGGAAAKDVAEPVDIILDNSDANKMDVGAIQSDN